MRGGNRVEKKFTKSVKIGKFVSLSRGGWVGKGRS